MVLGPWTSEVKVLAGLVSPMATSWLRSLTWHQARGPPQWSLSYKETNTLQGPTSTPHHTAGLASSRWIYKATSIHKAELNTFPIDTLGGLLSLRHTAGNQRRPCCMASLVLRPQKRPSLRTAEGLGEERDHQEHVLQRCKWLMRVL